MEEKKQAAQEPRIIKNRDIPLLSRVLYVMQDVCSLETRQEWQRERMYNITQKITGMPGAKGQPNGFDAAFAALDELCDEQRGRIAAYMRELKTAEKIINSIESRTMRTFVVMMYVDEIPSTVIQKELNMTRRGFENARNAIEQAEDMASVVWRERYMLEK